MEYKGKLYGHLCGKKYFDTGKTTYDWDAMVKRISELETEIKVLRKEENLSCDSCVFNTDSWSEDYPCATCCGFDKHQQLPMTLRF